MLRRKIFRSKALPLGVMAVFLLLFIPVEALTQAQAAKKGTLTGIIYGADMTKPVEKAVVKIRNTKDKTQYQSTPTDKTGMYKIENINEGRYILWVSTAAGDFKFKYMILVKGDEVGKLSLALKPAGLLGVSREKLEVEAKKPFLGTPGGIAVVVGASAVAIYGSYKLLVEEEEVSPSKR